MARVEPPHASDLGLPPAAFSSALPRGVRRVVAVGGGRPGVGHSVLSVNLAVYLAQLGRKVVLIDSDGANGSLHAMLGVEPAEKLVSADPFAEEALEPIATGVPGLALVPQEYTQYSTLPLRPGRKPRWAKGLRMLDADYVILDLGGGTAPASLDLFLSADFGLCPTAPDPPSVEASYRFLKALFQRQLRRHLLKDRYRMRQLERALGQLPPLPSPIELLRTLAKYDAAAADAAFSQLASLRCFLVTNGTRLRQDVELGRTMADLSERYLGVRLEYMGHVEHDDAIWLSVVRRRPLLLDNPTSKSAKNLERIARRVVAVATARDALARQESDSASLDFREERETSLYDVLWTHRGASDEELRRAYKHQREVFEPGSLPMSSLLRGERLARDRARVEEASETLLDPMRRRAYDLTFFADDSARDQKRRPEADGAILAERALLREELAHELHPQTEFSGELFRRVRESQGIEIEDIARRTKIARLHLEAIESEDFGKLPAEVYTRGFVSQVARILGLDATQATRTYIRRYKAHQKAHREP
jgi:flagellar biosynthesis protein FlhG